MQVLILPSIFAATTIPLEPETTKRFTDLGNHKWAEDAIYRLVEAGVVNGTSETTYSPGVNITRADFTTLIVRAFKFEAEVATFKDVDPSKYYATPVGIAKTLGIVGGVNATTLYPASKKYNIPLVTMMGHGWVQLFDNELEAFKVYLEEHGEDGSLLVDTYDTLDSGVKNAIEAFNTVLVPKGLRPAGIIIDSGDMTYLSKRARRLLDEAGFPDCDIFASNSLDETLIKDMLNQGAKIDGFIVGEKLLTSASSPVLDGVYKLCETEKNGVKTPAIMVSNNVNKITTPCSKRVWRLFDMESGKAIADVLTLDSENISEEKSYSLFDPDFTWKRKTVDNFVAREMLVKVFEGGKCIYNCPSLEDVRAYCNEQVSALWEEVTRFENPHKYYVDFSGKLWGVKQALIEKITRCSESEEQ